MGRVGSALDNAAAESFNSTLEHELLSRRRFATTDQDRREVARFIDAYNHRRRHSSCEMLPPVTYERLLAEQAARQTGPGGVKPALSCLLSPPATTSGVTMPADGRLHQLSAPLHGSGEAHARGAADLGGLGAERIGRFVQPTRGNLAVGHQLNRSAPRQR